MICLVSMICITPSLIKSYCLGPARRILGNVINQSAIMQRFQPLNALRCVLNCQTADRCPSPDDANDLLQSFNAECRRCVMDECGKYTKLFQKPHFIILLSAIINNNNKL